MLKQLILPVLLLQASAAVAQGGYAVVDSDPDQLFFIPLDGGAPVLIGVLPVDDVFGLAFDASGTLYGVSADSDELVVVDPESARATTVGPLGFDVSIAGGLTFDPDGNLWLVGDNDVFLVDDQSGQATLLGNLSASEVVWGLSACGDELTALYLAPGGLQMGLATIDAAALTLKILGGHQSLPGEPAGVDWFEQEVFSIENRISVASPPPPTSEGSFLLRLGSTGNVLDAYWLMNPHSLAFAIGPPSLDCGGAVTIEDVPSLSWAGIVALISLLGICAVQTLLRRDARVY